MTSFWGGMTFVTIDDQREEGCPKYAKIVWRHLSSALKLIIMHCQSVTFYPCVTLLSC